MTVSPWATRTVRGAGGKLADDGHELLVRQPQPPARRQRVLEAHHVQLAAAYDDIGVRKNDGATYGYYPYIMARL
jgi:hypothetical protein